MWILNARAKLYRRWFKLLNCVGASGRNWIEGSGTLPDSPHQYQHLEETSRCVILEIKWQVLQIFTSSGTFYMYFIHGTQGYKYPIFVHRSNTDRKQDRRKKQSQKLITSLSLFIFILNNPT